MAYNMKEIIATKRPHFTEGHRMCAGCGAPVVARHIMRALKEEDTAVVCSPDGQSLPREVFRRSHPRLPQTGYSQPVWINHSVEKRLCFPECP